MRSAVYLPPDAPSRPGAWHLPQVRAQALHALIEDVAGWPRNIHGLFVLLLGMAGASTLVLATSGMAQGVLFWLLVATASVALLAWVLWGLWLERSGWRAIAAAGRWHAAYVRGTGASGHVTTPSVRDVFTTAMVVRIAVALGLLAGAAWTLASAAPETGARSGHPGAYLALAAVLVVGSLAVLAGLVAMLVALRRRPSAEARARAQGQDRTHAAYPGQPQVSADGTGAPQPGHAVTFGPPGQTPLPSAHHPGPPAQQVPPAAQDGPGAPAGPGQPAPPSGWAQEPGPPAPPARPAAPPQRPAGVTGAAQGTGYAPEAPAGDGEELERTRLAARLGPVPSESRTREPGGVAVVLPDGRHLPGEATALIGRDPRAREGEQVEALLRVADQSVSKTHVQMRISGGRVSVTDRASTNGTVLVGPDGTRVELEPWRETAVRVGSTVRMGSTEILVMLPEDVS
ncbi:FHA domain-containing protein [Pseudactinotalea sp. Z1739]|uniref:FHA domain-containing protein n=1 Tax=Pseudactinotalea sp. Z1739 TaxID=3413028 RepID=UPI003C7D5333